MFFNAIISLYSNRIFRAVVSHCFYNKLPKLQWLKTIQTYYLISESKEILQIKVSSGLSSFWRIHSLAFSSFYGPPSFLSSWSLRPSSKPVTYSFFKSLCSLCIYLFIYDLSLSIIDLFIYLLTESIIYLPISHLCFHHHIFLFL